MSSIARSSPSRPVSTSSRLSQSDSTLSHSPSIRRRHNSYLDSTLSGALATTRMSHPISSLPPHRSGETSDGGPNYRDHNTTSFEWNIRNLAELRDHVESDVAGVWSVQAEMNDPETLPEVLRRGIVIGEGWYKLDIARTLPPVASLSDTIDDASGPADETKEMAFNTLSLYIAALSLDHLHYTYAASIFAGIKPSQANAGNRYAATEWYWHTSTNWEFTANTEYWECRLPKISQLLENPAVVEADAVTLCVQISSPASDKPTFTLPSRLDVPESIIGALGGLFDSKTGDVRFTCLEHRLEEAPDAQDAEEGTPKQVLTSRKRVLYAHSAVLKARGEYFQDLLHGGFSESEVARRGESRFTPIVVEDADYTTVHWMLRFIYTNALEFADLEDVRALMRQTQLCRSEVIKALTAGSPLYMGPGEWDYRHLPIEGEEVDDAFDGRTVKSVSSTGTRVSQVSGLSPASSISQRKSSMPPAPSTKPRVAPPPPKPVTGSKITRPTSATPTRPARSPSAASSSTLTPATNPKPQLSPQSNAAAASLATRHFVSRHTEADPHAHPADAPPPASALSIYMLAHRYRLESLELLAKDHILAQMTPDNCMPYLLASYSYDQLHREVLDYVIENWMDVQAKPEFLACIQEVSAGTWGESGGLVLHGLFRRL